MWNHVDLNNQPVEIVVNYQGNVVQHITAANNANVLLDFFNNNGQVTYLIRIANDLYIAPPPNIVALQNAGVMNFNATLHHQM